ncbi:DMT family transporter [Phytohabitans sp. ZYX-F-186]|uniref:DMT family transporter n=1 Tax=Phytohabitans maris TaxID=3071409 RepID=A0ABU0ZFD9_9ACTN|nr:DMT family transporter [Phytohabitans sp. ZYX-F-186]MDQ7905771.1 DMT family transporter [Phytohabitans sp. ZYX-F-186]
MPLAVSLSLVAAFLFAAAASLQQHGAQAANNSLEPPRTRGRVRATLAPLPALARRLVRSRVWLAGWVVNLVGFLTQAAALHFGSVALVQPLLVTQLLFALPLATAWSRRMPSRLAWSSAAAITGGVALFLAVRGAAPVEGDPNREHIILSGLATVVAVAGLVLASAGRRALVQATLLAVAAGLCFAMSAVLMKLTAADLIERGVGATARDWVGYALAGSTLAGLLLGQWAFATGSLAAAVAAMTITNPIASYLVGVLAFHVAPPTSPGALAAVAGAGALISAGVFGLSHSSIVRPARERTPAMAAREPDRITQDG